MNKLIAITGPIAAGATTLAKKMIARSQWQPLLERDVEATNPFFKRYNEDRRRWAFHNQIEFLTHSADLHADLRTRPGDNIFVQDYTPLEHVGRYAHVQHALGNLGNDEFALLGRLSHRLEEIFVVPRILVYRPISPDAVKARVEQRARPSEQMVDVKFLQAVAERFEAWISQWTLCPIIRVASTFDVEKDIADLEQIERKVRDALEP